MKRSRKKIRVFQYHAVFQEESDGGFSVWVPALPGCCSQGDNFEEAMVNIKEAIELCLESEPDLADDRDEAGNRQFLVPVSISYA